LEGIQLYLILALYVKLIEQGKLIVMELI